MSQRRDRASGMHRGRDITQCRDRDRAALIKESLIANRPLKIHAADMRYKVV